MSATMKAKVTRAVNRLRSTLVEFSNKEDNLREDIQELAEPQKILAYLDQWVKRLERDKKSIDQAISDVAVFIQRLDEEKQEIEDNKLTETINAEDGAYSMMEKADETLNVLQLLHDSIQKRIHVTTSTVPDEAPLNTHQTASNPSNNNTFPIERANNGRDSVNLTTLLNLPKIRLPTFSGNRADFARYWNLFENLVDSNQDLPDTMKLNYLMTTLQGEAAEVVTGIQFEAGNYSTIKTLIKDRFGNKESRERVLFTELYALRCRGESPSDARKFMDRMNAILNQMEAAHIDIEQENIRMSIESATPKWMDNYLMQAQVSADSWSTKQLRDVLTKIVDKMTLRQNRSQEETLTVVPAIQKSGFPDRNTTKSLVRNNPNIPRPINTNGTPRKKTELICFYCNKRGHVIAECRKRMANNSKIPTDHPNIHTSRNNQRRDKHRRVNFRSSSRTRERTTAVAPVDTEQVREIDAVQLSMPSPEATEVPLMCCEAKIVNMDTGKRAEALVFFDSGSQGSYVSKQLAETLQLNESEPDILRVNTFGGDKKEVPYTHVTIGIQKEDGSIYSIPAKKVDRVVNKIPTMRVSNQKTAIVREARVPSVIIGNDSLWEFIEGKADHTVQGYRVINSSLGRLLAGKSINPTVVTVAVGIDTATIDRQLAEWNSLETIGIRDSMDADENESAWEKLKTTTTFEDDRYVVSLPFKTDCPVMPDNLGICIRQLVGTQKRMHMDNKMQTHADNIVKEWLTDGVIEEVPNRELQESNGPLVIYHPFHLVTKDSKTTPYRLVHNGSAHRKGAPSLNNLLAVGPKLLPDMVAILLRFREATHVGTADVSKAFLQLGLHEPDQDALRFIYPKNWKAPICDQNLTHYRFKRVNFGLVCSPFLLAGVLKIHLEKSGTATDIEILRNCYVDNVLVTGDSRQEVHNKLDYAKMKFKEAGMNLGKFLTSDDKETDHASFLGIQWNLKGDQLTFKFNKMDLHQVTKRKLLSQVAQRFDPLGLTYPIQLQWKLAIQQLWKENYGWDETMSKETRDKLNKLNEADLCEISIPRVLPSKEVNLHVFVDASQAAFAAAAYFKSMSGDSIPHLTMCRARLAPAKGATIPKLELLAATIGSRLIRFIKENSSCRIHNVTLWSDSTVVLSWLHAENPNTPVFNRKRILEIKTNVNSFRYVPTSMNPADIASRGTNAQELKNSPLWWNGPAFLKENENTWPKMEIPIKRTDTILTTVRDTQSEQPNYLKTVDPERFSNWDRLMGTLMMVLIFLQKSSSGRRTSVNPIEESTRILLREAQKRNPPSRDNITNLKLYKDKDDLWKSLGRIGNSELPTGTKNPVFLPRTDKTTHLLIDKIHRSCAHGSVSTTLSALRQGYWLPRGRATVKRIIDKCSACKKRNTKPFALPPPPQLPAARVRECVPFANTGVDLAGPFNCKLRCGDTIKVWMVIFTCLASRCCHLELTSGLSSIDFMRTLRRMVSRRGRPLCFWSDNGTNFRGSLDVVTTWKSKEAEEVAYCESLGVKWTFIPSLSPWVGGHYERIVGIVKSTVRKTIPRKLLYFDELHSFLCEAEAIINCRPLLYVNDESKLLRPVDLLGLTLKPGLPLLDTHEENQEVDHSDLVNMWQNTRSRISKFWSIWKEDYLTSLRERHHTALRQGKSTTHREPRIGELVLLEDPNHPRLQWKMGKIIGLNSSKDTCVRSVTVETANGRQVKRSIALVHPLEMREDDQMKSTNTNVDPQEPHTGTTQTETEGPRYKLRPKRTKSYSSMFFVYLAGALLLSSTAAQCPTDAKTVYQPQCAHQGYSVYVKEGTYCWEMTSCNNGSLLPIKASPLQRDKHCGKPCKCPLWATGCVFSDPPKMNHRAAVKTLELLRPEFHTSPRHETDMLVLKQMSVVMLPDKTMHYVQGLDISLVQKTDPPFYCFGTGEVTGDEHFCKSHPCTLNATRFCAANTEEYALLNTPNGPVPITAWGTKGLKTYIPAETNTKLCNFSLACHPNGGIAVTDVSNCKLQFMEICVRQVCRRYNNFLLNHIRPSRNLLLTRQEYEIRLWRNGKEIAMKEITCDPQETCTLIECTYCSEALRNPKCLVNNLSIGLISLFALLFIIWLVRSKCRTVLRRRALPRQRRHARLLELLPLLIMTISGAQSCGTAASFQATTEECVITRTGAITCTFHDVNVITTRSNAPTCLVFKDGKQRTMTRVQLDVQLLHRCRPRTMFFTKKMKTQTYTVRRCPGLGSCKDDYCLWTRPNSSIPEFAQYNDQIGVSRCEQACGGPSCGCLTFGTGCRFSRTIADIEPSTPLLTIIECHWEKVAVVTITEESSSTKRRRSFTLLSGETSHSEETFNLTISAHQIDFQKNEPPEHHLLQSSPSIFAVLSKEHLQSAELFQCDRPDHCYLYHEKIGCRTADGLVSCTPANNNRLINAIDTRQIPIYFEERHYIVENGTVFAEDQGSITLQVDTNGYQAVLETEMSTCTMANVAVQGCYGCHSGTRIDYDCNTDFGRHLAEVSCPSRAFTVICGPGGSRTTFINFDSAKLDEECQLRCPGSTSTFHLRAHLNFIAEDTLDWTLDHVDTISTNILKEAYAVVSDHLHKAIISFITLFILYVVVRVILKCV